ncbi:hypothetical protein FB107DRAFT_172797, partial [Schizophyllum commune]
LAELCRVLDRLPLLRKGGETAYFSDVDQHARNMISYFEPYGSRPGQELGETATATQDWYDVWCRSSKAQRLQRE